MSTEDRAPDPAAARACADRGLAAARAGNYPRAVAEFTRALKLDGPSSRLLTNRGYALAAGPGPGRLHRGVAAGPAARGGAGRAG